MSQSHPPPGSFPTQEERLAMQEVANDAEGLERDREKAFVRQYVARLYENGGDALRQIGLALEEQDDHRLIVGLRKLLAVGASCKPPADQMEKLLPQPTRLFDPPTEPRRRPAGS